MQLIRVLERFYAAINRNDMQAIADDFDPQIVRVEPEGFPTSGTYRGLAQAQEHIARGRGSWAEGTCEPEGIFVNGNRAVVFLHAWVRKHGATEWGGGRFADGFEFRNGKITHYQSFAKRTDALGWAGIDNLLTGKCLCGAVQFTVEDSFAYALNCHCSNCRRATGSAFKPFAGIAREKLSVTQGSDGLLIFGEENAHDARCAKCGSFLYSVVREGKFVHVPLGALVDEPSIRPTAHIFVGSKAPWFTITDDLPQHHEFP